jgi:hypothetical protein
LGTPRQPLSLTLPCPRRKRPKRFLRPPSSSSSKSGRDHRETAAARRRRRDDRFGSRENGSKSRDDGTKSRHDVESFCADLEKFFPVVEEAAAVRTVFRHRRFEFGAVLSRLRHVRLRSKSSVSEDRDDGKKSRACSELSFQRRDPFSPSMPKSFAVLFEDRACRFESKSSRSELLPART